MRSIVGHGMALAIAGIGIGLVGVVGDHAVAEHAAGRRLAARSRDFAAIAILLTVIAFVASYLPGRRATRVDPMITLRAE